MIGSIARVHRFLRVRQRLDVSHVPSDDDLVLLPQQHLVPLRFIADADNDAVLLALLQRVLARYPVHAEGRPKDNDAAQIRRLARQHLER